MNRRLVTVTIAAIAVFGLTACSAPAATTPPAAPAAPAAPEAPAEPAAPAAPEADADAAAVAACMGLTGPLTEAQSKIATIASDPNADVQGAIDAWTALADSYNSIAADATNPEFKAAATAAAADVTTVRDLLQRVASGDAGAAGELATATGGMQTSQTALMAFCMP